MKEWRLSAVGNHTDAIYFSEKEKALEYAERVLKKTDNKMRLIIEHYTTHYDDWYRWYIEWDSNDDNGCR